MNKEKGEIIIIAPHPDDECIGTYEILSNKDYLPIIIYDGGETDKDRIEETKKIRKIFDIKAQLFQKTIPSHFINENNKFYFPDPIYDRHPLHRQWGHIGESLVRAGYNVIFYNTNMNAPYIHEVSFADKKRKALDEIYPSQKSLWESNHKYFLFEGYLKWLF